MRWCATWARHLADREVPRKEAPERRIGHGHRMRQTPATTIGIVKFQDHPLELIAESMSPHRIKDNTLGPLNTIGDTMKYRLILAFLCFCTMNSFASADCNGRPCGVGPMRWLTPQGHRGADFRPACQQHDNCYSQGLFSRKTCDNNYLNGMLSACQNSRNPKACARRARFMHGGVRLFGGLFYGR